MTLLEQIDNELNLLKEAMTPEEENEILIAAKSIDPKVVDLKNWGAGNTNWNKLVKLGKNGKPGYLLYLKNAKAANGSPLEDFYLNIYDNDVHLWDGKIVKYEEATLFNKKPSEKQINKIGLVDAKGVTYDKIEIVENISLDKVVEAYVQLFIVHWEALSDYWKRAITVSVSESENLISNNFIQLFNKAKNDTNLYSCLVNDNLASQVIWTLLSENNNMDMSVNQIIDYKNYFLLSLLVYGCYNKSGFNSVSDILQSFSVYDKVTKDFEGGSLKLGEIKSGDNSSVNLELLLNGTSNKDKAICFAQNIMVYKNSFEDNTIVKLYENVDYVKEFISNGSKVPTIFGKDNAGDKNALSEYFVCHIEQIKKILDEVVDSEKTEKSQTYLKLNKNFYSIIKGTDNNLIPTDKEIIIENKTPIIVATGLKSSIDDKSNVFIVTNLENAVKFDKFENANEYNNKIKDYFDIKNNTLVAKDSIKLSASSPTDLYEFKLDENGNIAQWIIKTQPQVPTEEEKDKAKQGNKETNTSKSNKLDKETKERLQEAIIKYLKTNKTKSLDADEKVDKFIKTPQEANYEKLKEMILNQLFENPTAYYYDEQNNEIKNIANTYLDILVTLLNKDLEAAKNKLTNISSHNISPYIDVQYRKLRAPELHSKEVATKLNNLANILNTDNSNAVNKIDSNVKKELENYKDDLANIIAWFNSRFRKGNSAKVAKEVSNTEKSSENS